MLICVAGFLFVCFLFLFLVPTIASDRRQFAAAIWWRCYRQVCLGVSSPEITHCKPQC